MSPQFAFVDPLDLGGNFPFNTLPTTIRGERVWAEEDEINTQLRQYTENIRDNNVTNPQILCAADFPMRFSSDSLNRIVTIARHGATKGIHLIIHVDSNLSLPKDYDPSPLISASSVIFVTPDGVKAKINDKEYKFEPDDLPDDDLLEALLAKIGQE